ncbi:MAG TPA: QueG-associated DUF1730 domain-containing protein, partial [bacterium]|nr:QueG-associated DUF1730 domain-containing protein [bacterium]
MSTEAAEGVKAYAREIGFDLVGITAADAFPEEEARLGSWVEAGMHGAMGYVAEHAPRAARPAEVVPGARSAVVVAMAYRWDPEAPEDGRLRGRISAYAWGTDYHLVMEQRLAQLSEFLMARGARVARYYVDTGP